MAEQSQMYAGFSVSRSGLLISAAVLMSVSGWVFLAPTESGDLLFDRAEHLAAMFGMLIACVEAFLGAVATWKSMRPRRGDEVTA